MANKGRKQKGVGSKSSKDPGASSRKRKRQRSHAKLEKKRDQHVAKSSHGVYQTVAALKKREKAAKLEKVAAYRSRIDNQTKAADLMGVTSLAAPPKKKGEEATDAG